MEHINIIINADFVGPKGASGSLVNGFLMTNQLLMAYLMITVCGFWTMVSSASFSLPMSYLEEFGKIGFLNIVFLTIHLHITFGSILADSSQ